MIDFIDHVPGEGMSGKRKITHSDGKSEIVKVELADNAVEQGTDINRINMMALQGFIAKTIKFNKDGTIIETNDRGQTITTTFNKDSSITATFVGDKTITKTTTFVGTDIKEVIS